MDEFTQNILETQMLVQQAIVQLHVMQELNKHSIELNGKLATYTEDDKDVQ